MARTPCCEKMGMKKGPWTPEEDQILISHIHQFGHGNWRALPKQAGLLRCGKSCRLRWINYLRPDVGNFTDDERDAIIHLHQVLGNRWSAIASRLPGRTDNEIKNFWHTHLKKPVPHSLANPTPFNISPTHCTTTLDHSLQNPTSALPTRKFREPSTMTTSASDPSIVVPANIESNSQTALPSRAQKFAKTEKESRYGFGPSFSITSRRDGGLAIFGAESSENEGRQRHGVLAGSSGESRRWTSVVEYRRDAIGKKQWQFKNDEHLPFMAMSEKCFGLWCGTNSDLFPSSYRFC